MSPTPNNWDIGVCSDTSKTLWKHLNFEADLTQRDKSDVWVVQASQVGSDQQLNDKVQLKQLSQATGLSVNTEQKQIPHRSLIMFHFCDVTFPFPLAFQSGYDQVKQQSHTTVPSELSLSPTQELSACSHKNKWWKPPLSDLWQS